MSFVWEIKVKYVNNCYEIPVELFYVDAWILFLAQDVEHGYRMGIGSVGV